MRTKSQAEKKSQIDKLKYIPMPILTIEYLLLKN